MTGQTSWPYRIDELAAVTVTFNPDLTVFERQLNALRGVGIVVIVDNASSPEVVYELRQLAVRFPDVVLVESGLNEGLACALNKGMQVAREKAATCRAVMLLDQDSTFAPEVPAGLLAALGDQERATGNLCCVGPALIDPVSGTNHGFHRIEGWLWARVHPAATSREPVRVDNLNGSGTVMSFALVDHAGRLDDDLFIDHIDTEWAFRIKSMGYGLYGIPWFCFDHRMGERSRRLWLLGWRAWPERSPVRRYYLVRNTVRLLRRDYVPQVWKAWACVRLLADAAITFATDSRRKEQMRSIWRGLNDGLKPR